MHKDNLLVALELTLVICLLGMLLLALLPHPRPIKLYGIASWYRATQPGLTAAMWGVKKGRRVKVTNVENGRKVYVTITDRGPAWQLVEQGRIIDLDHFAFAQIADTKKGLISVQVEIDRD